MSTLAERLQAKKPREEVVEIDGDHYLVRSISRIEKINIVERSSRKGEVDPARFEAEYFAACVFDPDTLQPLQPDWKQWDIQSYISDPLGEAVMRINGIKGERVDIVKKSVETEN